MDAKREIWCGVCENKNPRCLTCFNVRANIARREAWEAGVISQWVDEMTPKWYANETPEERERLWKLSQTLSA